MSKLDKLASLQAERSILGSVLIDPDAIVELADQLSPADFFFKSNGRIYQAMLDLFEEQQAIDLVTVHAALDGHEVGDGRDKGMDYLTQLMLDTATSCHIMEYREIVVELAERRRLVLAGHSISQLANNLVLGIDRVREEAHKTILDSTTGRQNGTQPVGELARPWLDDMTDRLDNPGRRPGIDTGYYDFDRMTNGLQPHRLYIIAGRPGMGKTALILGIAFNLAVLAGRPGIIFSLEMGANEILNRLIARQINVETQRLERGELDDDERVLFMRAVGELAQAPLWIDDTAGLGVLEMRARATRTKALNRGRLDWIAVDFLQLARMPGAKPGYDEVSQVARELKNLSGALELPTIAASQLNRKVEERNDKRPLLSDLRESGQIEEAADLVGLLYREDYYTSEGPPTNIGEVHVAKQRGGPTGKFELYWKAETASYLNLRKERLNL